jgi:hypothetical protein
MRSDPVNRSLSDLRVRIKINAPECPLSRFYSDLGLLPWSKTGDFGEKRAKPDSLLALLRGLAAKNAYFRGSMARECAVLQGVSLQKGL